MDEQSRSERALETAPAGAAITGPTYGARPGGTKFATSRSGLAALPSRPPPSPHFAGPRERDAGKPIGRISPPWYKATWVKVVAGLAVVAVIAVIAMQLIGGGGSTEQAIEAQPGAPAPTGYRMVTTDSYQIAVPRAWNTESLDAQVMRASSTATDADNELIVATDPATRDTVNVVPYEASSASLEKRVLAEFEADFRNGVADTQILTLRVDPAKVHGFPAGKLSASVVGRDGAAKVITTVVETTEGLFQITVTSANPQRAGILDSMVLPTFDIR